MAVLGGVQHLAVGVAERPQGSSGGAADGGGVCRVRRSRVVRRTGLHAMITLPAFPGVHLSDVVVADRRVGVVVREVEGVHIVAQLCKYILQQQGEVTRLDQ